MASLGCSSTMALSLYRQPVSLITHPKRKSLPLLSRDKWNYSYRLCPKLTTMATLSSGTCNDEESKHEKVRPLAHFEPDAWGDYFLDYTPESEEAHEKKEKEHRLLKDEFERELLKVRDEPIEFLKLVDVLERLGVAYHFTTLIEENLERIYENDKACIQKVNSLDLYNTSLMFRILRQHRYYITSNVFERFLDDNGNFLESLKEDTTTMLCLYEAAYIKTHGDGILEKALEFTKNHLEVIAHDQSNHPLATQIKRSLRYPIQRGVIRLESRHYISFYEQSLCHNTRLVRFAKLDFDLLQSLYKEELKEITRWKQRFNFAEKFSFARFRTVESHFFSIGTFYESKFSMARKIYTKCFIVFTILDDIFDAFGTIDELEIFTQVIERWDRGCTLQLPPYMKEYFEIIYDVLMELEEDLAKLGRINYVDYLRREVIHLSRAYLHEAYWREAKYVPTYEEYIENGIRSSAVSLTICISLLENEVEESLARKTFDIVCNHENPERAACIMGRCLDDIADYELDSQSRDHVVGAVDCYMQQHGVSKEEAFIAINGVIEDCWKDLDAEIFQPSTFIIPTPLLMRLHNMSRLASYVYKDEDGYTLLTRRMKDTLTLLYVEPIFTSCST